MFAACRCVYETVDALLAEPETGLQLLLTQYGGLIHTVICRILPNNPQDAEDVYKRQVPAAQPLPPPTAIFFASASLTLG